MTDILPDERGHGWRVLGDPAMGHSLGLEYPYLFGEVGNGTWAVWSRETGTVVAMFTGWEKTTLWNLEKKDALGWPWSPSNDQLSWWARDLATKLCTKLCGLGEGVSEEVLAGIDATG